MNTIEHAMAETVSSIWASILGKDVFPVLDGDHDDAHEATFVGCIHVTGPEVGVVMLRCPAGLATELASAMFSLPCADVGVSDAQDALGELTNIMGGNFKAMLSDGHHLSLPTVVEGNDFRTKFIGTRLVARVGFECDGRHVVASFYRDGALAGGAGDTGVSRVTAVHGM